MKILVTGASGFIGNHVIKELLTQRHDVVATCLPQDDLSNYSWSPDVKTVKFDFSSISKEKINLFDRFEKPDALIHLAWQGLPNYKNRIHIEKVLFEQIYVLKNLIENGLKNITVTGTCLEYGMVSGELSEEMIPNPKTYYSIAKDTLRKYLESLQSNFQFNLKWVRLFYIYGEGQNPKSIIPQLIAAINNKESLFNMSAGEQIRDYLPVEVVAEYIVKTCTQNEIQGIINCCSGEPISIRRLVENIIKKHQASIKLNLGYYPYPDYEPFAFWGSNKKLKKILNLQKQ